MNNSSFVRQQDFKTYRNLTEPYRRGVSSNTALRRINLVLKQRGEIIRKCRQDNRYHDVLGDYYLEDAETRRIIMPHVNLKVYADRFRVIEDWEVFPG